jgi:hypothetical protein
MLAVNKFIQQNVLKLNSEDLLFAFVFLWIVQRY